MSCVDELRQKAVDKSCPLCRKPLPPGPEKLFDLGYLLYTKIKGAIHRSRPGIALEAPWPTLSAEQQREMDQAVALLKEAADQGHAEAQANCGELYRFGLLRYWHIFMSMGTHVAAVHKQTTRNGVPDDVEPDT